MKRAGKFAVPFVGGLLCLNSLLADDAVLPGNPYAIVVARNIFGLNPPPPADPNADKAAEPPVKIIPNGIMSIFGQLQVLFKVTAKPPGKDESYIFTEGQSQDDIEVVKINEKAGTVTFNNHGIVQELPLVATPASSSATPAPGSGNPNVPGITPTPGASTGGNNSFSRRFGSQGNANGGNSGNPNAGLGNAPTHSNIFNATSQIPEGMTPEVQTVAIEVNRELTKQQVIDGTMPPLPITELTPQDAVGSGGAPLMVPAPQ